MGAGPTDEPACAGAPTRVFFEDIWPEREDGTPSPTDPTALEFARARYCRSCPVRRSCLEVAMQAEDAKDNDRWGLFGYLTPAQRRSVKRRRALRCGGCGAVRDPVLLAQGVYRCPENCGEPERRVDPIPVDGDQWTKRHTALARKVLTWIADHVDIGGEVPPIYALAQTLSVRRADMARVYGALVADGTLDREGPVNAPTYRRRGHTGATSWTPRFIERVLD